MGTLNSYRDALADMSNDEISDYLLDIEDEAQDAWGNAELEALRNERDKARAEIERRKVQP